MTDHWRPLPIPMLPANEDLAESAAANCKDQAVENADKFDGNEVKLAAALYPTGRAKAERDALEMMERAKAMMRESERCPRS